MKKRMPYNKIGGNESTLKLERTKNAIYNTMWGGIYRIVALIGPFIVKTIIIKRLGMEYSGLNTLFNSILTVLNLANLGFSSSLVYTMYEAVAREDYKNLCAMLNFFRKVYRMIGLVILGMGIAVMPFLPELVGGECPSNVNLYIMFGLYLSATVMDYLLFGYVNAIFSAYQREDIRLKIMTVRYIIQYALQILLLSVFADYYAYLLTLPLLVIPNSLANYAAAKKLYPRIRCAGAPSKEVKQRVYCRVRTLFAHKVGNTLLVNVDSIIISAFLGLSVQSLFSNYYYILTAVNGVVEIIPNGCLAGIGNKLIIDSEEENHRMFLNLTYGWAALIGICAVCLLCLYQPFIGGIWIGSDGLLEDKVVIFLAAFFYSWMFRIMQLTYRDAAGLWMKDWLKPLISMVLKLGFSIPLIQYTESIVGALMPTIFIMFFIYFPWEVKVLYDNLFHCSWIGYMRRMIRYMAVSALGAAACYFLSLKFAGENSPMSFFIRLGIVFIVFPLVWIVMTCQMDEFRYCILKIATLPIRRKKR